MASYALEPTRATLRGTISREHPPILTIASSMSSCTPKVIQPSAVLARGMMQLIQEQFQGTRTDALALASVTANLRITQIVNGVRGVHAILPYGAIR